MAKKDLNYSYLRSLDPKQVYERLKLVWGLYKDDRISKYAKLTLLIGIGYAAMPIDLIPDFIPGLGLIDDVFVLILVGDWFIKLCPPDIVEEHRSLIKTGQSDFDEDLRTTIYIIKNEFREIFKRR